MKLDIGCGKNKQAGFLGVDAIAFEGVDIVWDVRNTPWSRPRTADDPGDANFVGLASDSVEELYTSHFVEHLTREEWVPFFNEAWRVLKEGAKLTVITPNWSHDCAWGDPTHKSFLSSWVAQYLQRSWREVNAPHCGYACNFDWTVGFSADPWLHTRHQDVQMFAIQRHTNSWRDLIITLVKRA